MNPIIGCKYCVLKFVKSSIVCVRRRYVWQRFHGILNRNLKLPWYLKIVARYDVSRKHYATVSPFWRANSPRDSPRKLIAARNNGVTHRSARFQASNHTTVYGVLAHFPWCSSRAAHTLSYPNALRVWQTRTVGARDIAKSYNNNEPDRNWNWWYNRLFS